MKVRLRETRGIITFPCCPKEKMIVFRESVRGGVSIKCPKCGKYVQFDFEKMEGKPFHALKGATSL